jgi:hypothetical protein
MTPFFFVAFRTTMTAPDCIVYSSSKDHRYFFTTSKNAGHAGQQSTPHSPPQPFAALPAGPKANRNPSLLTYKCNYPTMAGERWQPGNDK